MDKLEDILRQIGVSEQLIEQAIYQAIVCGSVELVYTDDKKIKIKNPFTGCSCCG
jgi:hypothetical protein